MKENLLLLKNLLEPYKYITSVSKNVYTDKLDNIVNKCNNTYHRKSKMKTADVKSSTHIDFNKENDENILNSKFVIML